MNRLCLIRALRLFCLATGCCLLAGGFAPHVAAAGTETSRLWGLAGEMWEPGGRLPDYSYAGYQRGELPLPEHRPDVSVKDFGGVGDGKTDDTTAIKRALQEAPGKVIAFPRGRYLITDIIEIKHSGTVLQGAGPQQTIFYVPQPLEKIRPNLGATTEGRATSNYSWSGGIIWAKGRWDSEMLSKVTTPAQRGEKVLVVDQPERFQLGDEIRLVLRDDANHSLTDHLYAGDPGDIDNLKGVQETWVARVVQVDRTTSCITFDRPLGTDVRPEWEPLLFPARSTAEEIGIEHLAFEFPVTPYQGHFTELGYNAIAFNGVRNGWVRDIEIRHADSGMFIGGTNITITGIVWASDRRRDSGRRNSTGHHGITLSGTDQLLSDFDFRTKFIHDITMTRGSAGNVVRGGRGEDLNFDHHKYANHANLFTNIDAGESTNIFRSGGGAKLGRHCGAWTTWWNIRTNQPVVVPAGWATDTINIIGVSSAAPNSTAEGVWYEVTVPDTLRPPDLYESQLSRRMATDN